MSLFSPWQSLLQNSAGHEKIQTMFKNLFYMTKKLIYKPQSNGSG